MTRSVSTPYIFNVTVYVSRSFFYNYLRMTYEKDVPIYFYPKVKLLQIFHDASVILKIENIESIKSLTVCELVRVKAMFKNKGLHWIDWCKRNFFIKN